MTTSLTATTQPTIWQDATPKAQVNDIIRKPFCPIARVVNKEVLVDGRTCLFVEFPGCRDHSAEEWVLPAVEVTPEPALTLTTVSETDQQPPGRGDGRGRVQPAKTDKTMNPLNYKTQTGLIKALTRKSEQPMTVSSAWWFEKAKYALINNFEWEEEKASQFIAAYHPKTSAYKATA